MCCTQQAQCVAPHLCGQRQRSSPVGVAEAEAGGGVERPLSRVQAARRRSAPVLPWRGGHVQAESLTAGRACGCPLPSQQPGRAGRPTAWKQGGESSAPGSRGSRSPGTGRGGAHGPCLADRRRVRRPRRRRLAWRFARRPGALQHCVKAAQLWAQRRRRRGAGAVLVHQVPRHCVTASTQAPRSVGLSV